MQIEINDLYISNLFFGKRQLRHSIFKKYSQDLNSNIYKYIISRYSDSESFIESLYRIKFNIEKRPTCEECGKPLKFICRNGKDIFNKFCSRKCSNNNELTKNHLKDTCIQKYGVDNVAKSQIVKDKYIKHIREKYSDDTITNAFQAKTVIEKIKKTSLEKYGVTNFGATYKHQQKLKSKEIILKRTETKRKNGTFNTSIPEKKSYELLKEIFPDVLYQYKSDVYPFACDFYIPSLDLYIECNYHWTHGKKPFEDNESDKLIIKNWKAKNTQFYNNAIKTWAISDVKKRTMAKENKLNYLEFWNIEELKEWLKNNNIK